MPRKHRACDSRRAAVRWSGAGAAFMAARDGLSRPAALASPGQRRHCNGMYLPTPEFPTDSQAQRAHDRRRLLRALNASLAFALVLGAVFLAQPYFDVAAWTVQPHAFSGLRGLLAAPLLHGSLEHLAANATSLLLLG